MVVSDVLLNFFLAVLGLQCCAGAFSSERGGLRCGMRASRCRDFSCRGARATDVWATVVGEHWLSCPSACGILPDQGSNPCPLQRQVDS